MLTTRILSCLLLVQAALLGARGQTCNLLVGQYHYCQCEMSDGSGVIDLSPYANQNGQSALTVKAVTNEVEYEYDINLCFALTSCGATSQSAAGCQERTSDQSAWSTGDFTTAGFVVEGNDVSLQFINGEDDRKMVIHLQCDENANVINPGFRFDGEITYFVYEFTLTTPCACPTANGVCGKGGGGGGGGGGGSNGSSDPGVVGIVLMVLAFTAFVTYFIVGAVILRVRYEKSGADLIIHKTFWKDFPFLVKDGVVFTFSPLTNAIRNRRSGYSTMDK